MVQNDQDYQRRAQVIDKEQTAVLPMAVNFLAPSPTQSGDTQAKRFNMHITQKP